MQALSMKQQVLAAQVQKTDALDDDDEDVSAAKAMADYLQNERKMWLSVKDTQFYKNLCKHKKLGAPVQLRDWLRLLLQVDNSVSITELIRICDEEDSIIAMSSVRFNSHRMLLALNTRTQISYIHPLDASAVSAEDACPVCTTTSVLNAFQRTITSITCGCSEPE